MSETVNWRAEFPQLELYENEPLDARTTFRVGGRARWFLCPHSVAEAGDILKRCRAQGIKPFFFGNGSNILASDDGYDGVILSAARLDGLRLGDAGEIVAESGVSLARLAQFAAEHSLTGLEFAAGIPGSVGGGTRMNAGAYGGELKDVLLWVEGLDARGEVRRFSAQECDFSYRHSLFCGGEWFITAACFALQEGDAGQIRAKMADFAARRREKQPLEYPSAGSTFKRPQGHFAAALIDQCGLRGLRVGGAQVSEKHAGFVVNVGNATAADVLAVMEQVKRTVAAQTGVTLEPEVEILG